MTTRLTTSWDLIHDAAGGDSAARQGFAERYDAVVRGYLLRRWRGTPLGSECDDAVQEVFLDCMRDGGALCRANAERGEFRGFLFGVVRNVALRFERAHAHRLARVGGGSALGELIGDETAASALFDREWARATLRLAMQIHAERAPQPSAGRHGRHELLRLRFEDGLPIRTIAERWDCDAAWLHHEFARARRDFKRALGEALGLPPDVAPDRLDAEIGRLRDVLC